MGAPTETILISGLGMSSNASSVKAFSVDDFDITELNWTGILLKKAFKSLLKLSWKRRLCIFDAKRLSLNWYSSTAATLGADPLGSFAINPVDCQLALTNEHNKDHEVRIVSDGNAFFGCAQSLAEAQDLLRKIDAARRLAIAGDMGPEHLLPSTSSTISALWSTFELHDHTPKAFVWGANVGVASGQDELIVSSVPQCVKAKIEPGSSSSAEISIPALSASAGSEHAAVISTEAAGYLWGGNDFHQTAAAHDAAQGEIICPYVPSFLAAPKVISLACGGTHTLAVVSETGGRSGQVMAWGSGTFGQLGLGDGVKLSRRPRPVAMPGTISSSGVPVLCTSVYASSLSSAAVSELGELFVWGDASMGRLGLRSIPDVSTPPGTAPAFAGAAIQWSPANVPFNSSQLGDTFAGNEDLNCAVVSVALGGTFSMFLVYPGSGSGCILFVTGALGADITKDTYGYCLDTPADITATEQRILAEQHVPKRLYPTPIEPFGLRPVVVAIAAGSRHAAVIATVSEYADGAPRVFTAGKGWLSGEIPHPASAAGGGSVTVAATAGVDAARPALPSTPTHAGLNGAASPLAAAGKSTSGSGSLPASPSLASTSGSFSLGASMRSFLSGRSSGSATAVTSATTASTASTATGAVSSPRTPVLSVTRSTSTSSSFGFSDPAPVILPPPGHSTDCVFLPPPEVRLTFAPVAGELGHLDAVQVACGHSHTMAIVSDGSLWCWGRGDSGELGLGNLTNTTTPMKALTPQGHHWTHVVANAYYSIGVADKGACIPKKPKQLRDDWEESFLEMDEKVNDAYSKLAESLTAKAEADAEAVAAAVSVPASPVSEYGGDGGFSPGRGGGGGGGGAGAGARSGTKMAKAAAHLIAVSRATRRQTNFAGLSTPSAGGGTAGKPSDFMSAVMAARAAAAAAAASAAEVESISSSDTSPSDPAAQYRAAAATPDSYTRGTTGYDYTSATGNGSTYVTGHAGTTQDAYASSPLRVRSSFHAGITPPMQPVTAFPALGRSSASSSTS